MSRRGHLALVLHAHLPYVRHPERPLAPQEHWLLQAINDCYLPLTRVLLAAAARGSRFKLTLSLSPTLLAMLGDPHLNARYRDHTAGLLALCDAEGRRHADPGLKALARYYHQRLEGLAHWYLEDLHQDLPRAWLRLAAAGHLELMTTAATHGYLPLLRAEPTAVRAQLRVAGDAWGERMALAPGGLWLPECGFYPGLEREITAAGFTHCVLDTHAFARAVAPPASGVYAPRDVAGLAVFARDPDSAHEIWSRTTGYPGHPLYREHHRDLGHEAPAGALEGLLPPGVRAPIGIKYHRVTGGDGPKALYDPAAAAHQAAADAARFLLRRRAKLAEIGPLACPPTLVAAYDCELFGHWWFEGPAFLAALIHDLDRQDEVGTLTLSEHLARYGTAGSITPSASSWGERGYNARWLHPDTAWVHVALHQAVRDLRGLVRAHAGAGPARLRPLRQAARSLLLAQGSDWTFHLARAGEAAGYAEGRIRDQLARFRYLTSAPAAEDERRLHALEQMDNLFPALALAHFGE